MRKFLWAAALAALTIAFVTPAAFALRVAFQPPAQRAINSDTIVVGKVTAVAKDEVEVASPYAGATDKIKYTMATVKISDGVAGAGKMTEIKVGFIAPPKPDPNAKPPVIRPIRGGIRSPQLKEGDEMLLFLAKHPTADFYIMPNMSPPLDISNEQGKAEIEAVKNVVAMLADPMKGLKSDKPEVRGETAAVMIMKYRAFPTFGGEVEQVAIDADQNKLILKALSEADWSNTVRPGMSRGPNAVQAFYSLGFTEKDGWIAPVIVNAPGAPPLDFNAVQKDAFTQWLAGAGQKYVIKKNVPKTK
jgi:hypothetical protein